MGVYSENRIFGSAVEAPEPDMSYRDINDINRIMVEMVQDDLEFFEDIIRSDIQEAYIKNAINEGQDMSDRLVALQEGTIANFFKKISEILKKFWAKIVGWFKSIINKIGYTFADNKKLVNKYGKQLDRKTDLGKMEFKFRMQKQDTIGNITTSDLESALAKPKKELFETLTENSATVKSFQRLKDQVEKLEETLDEPGDIKMNAIKKLYSGIDISDADNKSIKKAIFDWYLEDEDTHTGFSIDFRKRVEDTLIGSKKSVSDLEKYKRDIEKYMKDEIGKVEKVAKYYDNHDNNIKHTDDKKSNDRNLVDSDNPDNGYATEGNYATYIAKGARVLNKVYGLIQDMLTTVTSAEIDVLHFDIKQCRRVYKQALGFTYHESAGVGVDTDDLGHAADFEFDVLWDEAE